MTKTRKTVSLPEKDYLAILDLILQLHNCRSRQELKAVLAARLLPMLQAQDSVYLWTDPDITAMEALDTIGFPEEDREILEKRIASNPLAKIMATQVRPVVATGIDYSMEQMRAGAETFFKAHPEYKWEEHPYIGCSHAIGLMDPPDASVLVSLQRRPPRPKAWTFREVRICELLRPHLIQAIKTVFLCEELARYKSLAEELADAPAPVALVRPDMRAVFVNRACRELLAAEPGKRLSKGLAEAAIAQAARFDPPYQTDHSETGFSFYTLPQGVFRLSVVPLAGKDGERDLLVRLKPAIEPVARMNLLLREKGLTGREMEICVLLKDGIDTQEIADRLFISIHTLRTHLRNIHEKMGAHTRAQLVAMLGRETAAEG